MKNFKYAFASAVLMFCACSTDDTPYHDLDAMDINPPALHTPSVIPENSTNPYDSVGGMYRQVLDRYLNKGDTDLSRKQLIRFVNRSSKPYTATGDPWQTLQGIITNSHLTLGAQTSLLDFTETVLILQYEGYQEQYTYITRYESMVMDHPDFTEEDKRVIFIFTSLVRHTFHAYTTVQPLTEGDEDDDWDILIGNMIEFIHLALEDTPDNVSNTVILSFARHSQKIKP